MNFLLSTIMSAFTVCALAWLGIVYIAIRQDNHQVGQGAIVAGQQTMINREGCAEASNLCALLGGKDCKDFKRLTGEIVEHYCCRKYGEGCYSK